jgi:hypothetical protein
MRTSDVGAPDDAVASPCAGLSREAVLAFAEVWGTAAAPAHHQTSLAKWRSSLSRVGLYDEPRMDASRTITDEAVEAWIFEPLGLYLADVPAAATPHRRPTRTRREDP